jgi:hypothetical protein
MAENEGKKTDRRVLVAIPIIAVILFLGVYLSNFGSFRSTIQKQVNSVLPVSDGKIPEGPDDSDLENGQGTNGSSANDTLGGGTSPGSGENSSTSDSGNVGCEAIQDPDERDWCYREKAVSQEDPSICTQIQEPYYRDSCYRYIAIETGDAIYCSYMNDDERRSWCREAVKS